MASRRLAGAAALGVACVAGVAGVLLLCLGPLSEAAGYLRTRDGWAALPLETAVTALAATALTACTGWLALATAAATVEALTGASSALVRTVSPAVVRRTVAICCGLAVGTGGSWVATAEPTEPEPSSATAATGLLSGLPLPDRATGSGPTTTSGRRTPAPGAVRAVTLSGRSPDSVHVVRRGDSLWAIASRLLASPDPRRVDSAWRSLYRANRSAVGPDPDLLRPGTVLHVPATLVTPGPSRGDGAVPSRLPRKDAS